MALSIKKYRVTAGRMAKGELVGFHYDASNHLLCIKPDSEEHRVVPLRVDSGVAGCVWGRMIFDVCLTQESTFLINFYASDIDEPVFSKASQLVGVVDGLLYEQKGRYLYIWIEVFCATEGWIKQMTFWTPDDPFIKAFPEIYRDQGDFFHRYLSVFSSIYMDFQDDIDNLHSLVDLDKASDKLLPLIGSWIGIELSPEIFSAKVMREILREAAFLNKYKGTKDVIYRIAQLIVRMDCIIVERNSFNGAMAHKNLEVINRLYGTTIYDYTLLIPRSPDPLIRRQLLMLLSQFTPVRVKVNLVFLKNSSSLDGYTYLDINAKLPTPHQASLDNCALLNGEGYIN